MDKKYNRHGLGNSRLYFIYKDMMRRCYDCKAKGYSNYGGRGIVVCDEWKEDILLFKAWADKTEYRDDLTLDRIDNNKNYTPDNCQWVSLEENSRKTRRSIMLGLEGKTQCTREWAREYKIHPNTLYERLAKGLPLERALFTPPEKQGPGSFTKIKVGEKIILVSELARESNIPAKIILQRLRRGCTDKEKLIKPLQKRVSNKF